MISLKRINTLVGMVLLMCLLLAPNLFAQNSGTTYLGIMPTAETLGRGGYSTSIGMFQYKEKEPDKPTETITQKIVIGDFFQEEHDVRYDADVSLVPVRLTFGVSDYVDFFVGGTYSIGDTKKIIFDYYETGEDRNRVYSQFLFDGTMGLKYNIKPDVGDGLPGISIGGSIQMGYTADDKKTSDGTFVDDTPADSFPYLGINTYLVGSQNFQIAKVHAALGAFLSSKSPRITDSFKLLIQAGGELAMSDNLFLIADFSTAQMYSGVEIESLVGVGLRYNITDRAAFSVSLASAPGFQFNLFIGGEKARIVAPTTPETGEEDLLF